jgi:hypothetical protein
VKQRPRVGRYLIYGLLDPRDRTLRYVGKTHLRRDIRLERHVQKALEGGRAPVSKWIRELREQGLLPHIFVLRRLPPEQDWRQGERESIERWRSWSPDELPVTIPPQTPKSSPTEIRRIRLLNVQDGGCGNAPAIVPRIYPVVRGRRRPRHPTRTTTARHITGV